MNHGRARQQINQLWDESIIPCLEDYIRIPCKSPGFDTDWEKHGYLDQAAVLMADWCRQQPVQGMKVEIVRHAGRTPVLLCEIDGTPGVGGTAGRVLMYGHLDKQPEFTGWSEGLGPWQPVIRDGRLYGRGGADDGYAIFSSLAAIRALQEQAVAHSRCVVLIESCEESGSADLPYYVEALKDRIGTPDLVICLDAECGSYDELWCTTSLRGNLTGTLRVEVLNEGVHSGAGTGVAPSPFRVLRSLLSRIENETTGELLIDALYAPIPADRQVQAQAAAEKLGDMTYRKMPFIDGVEPISHTPLELLLNNTWRPSLTVTGAEGLPALKDAGNVLLPGVAVKLSLRLPPTTDPAAAAQAVKQELEADPPYGAKVSFTVSGSLGGWNAPPLQPWLEQSMQAASQCVFGRDAVYKGTGGSIPFMGLLGERFPGTQFLVTGVLGPNANAHGPNEFLHLDYVKKLTLSVAAILADHRGNQGQGGVA
ncbi:MAG: M20 family metallopeptidase [Rhodocyclaceae bacterium]|nr:M20 family metallopeptidase [Rhodocyclaceae bacterium]